jgi:hypothetical protein
MSDETNTMKTGDAAVDAAILAEMDRLMAQAMEHASEIAGTSDLLVKTIELRDAYGLTMRAHALSQVSAKLLVIASKIDAIRSLPYAVPAQRKKLARAKRKKR